MLTRHANALYKLLERVDDIGCADVRKNQLLKWYGQEKMSVGIWRDVQEKWEELNNDSSLYVGEGDGVFALIYGKCLKATNESWFNDISTLAKRS